MDNELLNKLPEAIKEAESSLGITYTEEQLEAIRSAFKEGVYILNGGGGVGKTTVVKGIVAVWESLGKSYKGCALSGKAANVLKQNGIESSTIHKLLNINGYGSAHKANNPLSEDMIILDEASMVNASLFERLVNSISTGSLFIIIGDSGQLSGIGHGDILRDLLNTNEFNKTTLTKIHRQAADSGIIELASKFRNKEDFIDYNQKDYLKVLGVNKDMINYGYSSSLDAIDATKQMIQLYKNNMNHEDGIMDFQILTARRSGHATADNLSTNYLNNYAQSVFNPSDKPFINRGYYQLKEGDKVISNGNIYDVETSVADNKVNLYNGTMGIIKKIEPKKRVLYVKFEGIDPLVIINDGTLDNIELGYAITIHRSQGSTIPNVLVAFDISSYMLLSLQLAYTAITRAKDKCILITHNNALHKALRTDSSSKRNTFLVDLINNNI